MSVHSLYKNFFLFEYIFGLFVLFYHKADYLKPPTSGTLKIFIYYLLCIATIIIVWCFGFLYLVRGLADLVLAYCVAHTGFEIMTKPCLGLLNFGIRGMGRHGWLVFSGTLPEGRRVSLHRTTVGG